MADFHNTSMGRRFFECDIPHIADSLSDIAKELRRQNDLKERELNRQESSGPNLGDITGEFISTTVEGRIVED